MLYAGLDVHRKTTYISVIDEMGNQVRKSNLVSDEKSILDFLSDFDQKPKLAMESTSAWYWLYDALVDAGYEVLVANPKKNKAIASSKIKNDKVDSHMLAQLLRSDMLPTVYVSSLEMRALKELLRHRVRLVNDAIRFKNRIHNLLAKNNIQAPVKDVFSKKGMVFLSQLKLPDYHQMAFETYLMHLEVLNASIREWDAKVKQCAAENDQAKLLMSIPGIGPIGAMTILAEIGDVSRFKSHRQLASYAGLVPSLDSSAGKHRLGSITKQGSPWLRRSLVESAQVVGRLKGKRLNLYFRSKITKAGYKKAVIATAHRLLTFAYYVLRDQRPYSEQLQSTA